MQKIQLGKYTLTDQIGEGEFGVVFKANDDIGRVVAVKVLKPGWSFDPKVVERFRNEAKVASGLFHPHIATTLDFGHERGRLYLVMRYVEGRSLNTIISQEGRLPWKESVDTLGQIADALDYAHQRGLIHRDIKPANIIVSASEGAVLTDFGLIKAVRESGLSTTGVIMGTPNYLAPEIWEGQEATLQTDIYSLGCVFYEMLMGNKLFEGSSAPQIMKKHLLEGPRFPESWPEDVPAGVEGPLRKALAYNPEDRFQSTGEFFAALKAGATITPIPRRASDSVDQLQPKPQDERVEPVPPPTSKVISKPKAAKREKRRKGDRNIWIVVIVLFVIASLCVTTIAWIGLSGIDPLVLFTGPEATSTETLSLFPTQAIQPSSTWTTTPSPSLTLTNTPTDTPLPVPTQTDTATITPSSTATRTPTATRTHRPSITPNLKKTRQCEALEELGTPCP